jgi:hypothetical protein
MHKQRFVAGGLVDLIFHWDARVGALAASSCAALRLGMRSMAIGVPGTKVLIITHFFTKGGDS